jgi:hypothetical protein
MTGTNPTTVADRRYVGGVFLLFGIISVAGAAISFGTVETRQRALEEISP